MNSLARLMIGCSFLGALASAPAQTLLLNGSFESPTVGSPWYFRGAPTNWTSLGSGVDVTHINYEPAFTAGAQQGVQFLDMNQASGSVGGVYQLVSVSSGTNYQLSLYSASWRADSYGTLIYSLIDGGSNTVLATDSFTINSGSTGTNGTAWTLLTLSATATSSVLKVQIEQSASSVAGLAVDSVTLVAIPEPSEAAFACGVLALGVVGLHRMNQWRVRSAAKSARHT